jgi:hypothetical protein
MANEASWASRLGLLELVHLRNQDDVRRRARIGAEASVLGVCRWLSLKPDTGPCPQEAAAGNALPWL